MSGGMELIFHLLLVWGRSPWGQGPLGTPGKSDGGLCLGTDPGRAEQRDPCVGTTASRARIGQGADRLGRGRAGPCHRRSQLQPQHSLCSQSFAASPHVSATRIRGTGARRPSLLHRSCVSICHDADCPPVPEGLQGKGLGPLNASMSLRSSSDSRSPGDLGNWGQGETRPAAPLCAGVSVVLHHVLYHHVKIRKY